MKLVLFSDLHLDAQFAWLAGDRRLAQKRRQALRDTLLNIVELARAENAGALLCGGDLYEHERFSPDTGQFLRSTFERLQPLPVFIAPGNHDWLGPRSLYAQVHWSSNVHVFTGDRLEPATLVDGLTLWGAAHRAPAGTRGFLDGFRVDRGGVHLALFHGSETGWLPAQEEGKIAHAPFRAVQIEAAGLHHAFLGHYHRARDAARYTYPGNPDPLDFGEDPGRGAVVATVSPDGSLEREWRHVGVSEVHDVDVDVTGSASVQDVRLRVGEAVRGLTGMARVKLRGELAGEVDPRPRDLDDSAPWLDRLLVVATGVRSGYDLDVLALEATVRGQFVRDVRDGMLPDDERRRVLLTGLRALDGRDDLEVV